MPTYEYECEKCRRVFEVKQRISEPALTTCDACGGAIRRLLSAAPFILKGGGWYVTDYPSEARKKALKSEKGGDDGAKPAADKAERKPDTAESKTDKAESKADKAESKADKAERKADKAESSKGSSGTTAPSATAASTPRPASSD